jgi:hypothetical protein
MACYPLQGLPMTIQFTQGDNMYDMQYTTAFTNLKMRRIGCDRSAPVYQIPAQECLCDGCQTNERWDGKPDQTPLTRHDMNFWLFSGEPTTT